MSKFDIMQYLVPKLTSSFAFVKLTLKIALERRIFFFTQMSNFNFGILIWHYITDAIIKAFNGRKKNLLKCKINQAQNFKLKEN